MSRILRIGNPARRVFNRGLHLPPERVCFQKTFRHLREIIVSGVLGKVYQIKLRRGDLFGKPNRPSPAKPGKGVDMDDILGFLHAWIREAKPFPITFDERVAVIEVVIEVVSEVKMGIRFE